MSKLSAIRRVDTSSPQTLDRDIMRLVQIVDEEIDNLQPGQAGPAAFDPYDYGAVGTGVDAAPGIQRAINAAGAVYAATGIVQTVRFRPGRYGMAPGAGVAWAMPLQGTTAPVRVSVYLASGVTLDCTDATFCPLPGTPSTDHYAMFGTALNMTVGTVERVALIQPTFDFTPSGFSVNVYGVIAVGVDDLLIDRPVFTSSYSTRGRGLKVLNSQNVRMPGIVAKNITQVLFAGYVTGLKFSGHVDGFVEAFDMDAPCYLVDADVTCVNGVGEAQCLDIASVQDGHFKLRCQSVGNAAIVYQKLDGHPTFAEWCVNFPSGVNATAPVFSKRIFLDVVGNDIHSDDLRAIQLNLDRTSSTAWDGIDDHMRDITVRCHLTDTDLFLVYEGENLDLDINMRDVTTGSAARINNAAVILRSARLGAAPLAESKLSGRARINVVNSTRTGVRVSCPTDLDIECSVSGYNSADDAGSGVASGVWLEDLAQKNGTVTLGPMRVSNGDTTVTPTDLRLTYNGSSGTTHVNDLGGHRLTTSGATALSVAVDAGSVSAVHGGLAGPDTLVASIDTTAATPVDVYLRNCSKDRLRLVEAYVTNVAAVPAGGANFTSLSMRRLRAGTVSGVIGTDTNYDAGAITAGTATRLDVDGTDSDGIFEPGDVLLIRGTRQGAGSVLSDLFVKAVFMEYSV